MTDVRVLDNPVWHALTGPQTAIATRNELAARYPIDVAPWCALPDDPTPDAWDALRALVGPGAVAVLFRAVGLTLPRGWAIEFHRPGAQFEASAVVGDDSLDVDPLTVADVPAMLDLVERTHPGPFAARTVELGGYVGVRDGATLAAMAGHRMHPPGHVEISAVCTDPAYRGRGIGTAMLRLLIHRIRAGGDLPFLHAAATNTVAIGLYETMGFTVHHESEVFGLRAPA